MPCSDASLRGPDGAWEVSAGIADDRSRARNPVALVAPAFAMGGWPAERLAGYTADASAAPSLAQAILIKEKFLPARSGGNTEREIMRSLILRGVGALTLTLMFALVTGIGSGSAVHAQSSGGASTATASPSSTSSSGATCDIYDGMCAYCMNHASSDLCPASAAAAPSAQAGSSTPDMGSMSSMPMPMPMSMSGGSAMPGVDTMVGASWNMCTIVGGGMVWVQGGTSPPAQTSLPNAMC
jgi:hypothetical protein